MKITLLLQAVILCAACSTAKPATSGTPEKHKEADVRAEVADSLAEPTEIIRLTDDDYREVAEMLGVETAAIKAVVDIEAGREHQGFYAPGLPIINFDLTMFRQHARRAGINLSRYSRSHAVVFAAPNARRYGSTQAAQQERLRMARTIDEKTAVQGTFWGMFQIGGFNWKLCGCSSLEEFVTRMSRSERDQLELFANFIKSIGIDKALVNKNWAAFARRYNGPSYASRGYHTRMAAAYKRHKSLESK